jgi:hypothetical protein
MSWKDILKTSYLKGEDDTKNNNDYIYNKLYHNDMIESHNNSWNSKSDPQMFRYKKDQLIPIAKELDEKYPELRFNVVDNWEPPLGGESSQYYTIEVYIRDDSIKDFYPKIGD